MSALARAAVRTVASPCPVCGARDGDVVLRAPAQLARIDQEFAFVRCAACNLTYLRDRVPPEDLARIEGDAGYVLHRGPSAWGPFAPLVRKDLASTDRARVERVTGARRVSPGELVVDLGCGTPTFLAALRRATHARALGLEVVKPDEPLEDAGVELLVAPAGEWPERLRALPPVAAFTLWHALEHDPQPLATLRWMRERLAPDGVVVIEVPDATGDTARWMGAYWPGYHTPRHASVFTPETLRGTVERAGYRVVTHERRGTLPPYTLLALGALDRAGLRFDARTTPAVFPLWAAGYALGYPAFGRREREGMGLQTVVLRAR